MSAHRVQSTLRRVVTGLVLLVTAAPSRALEPEPRPPTVDESVAIRIGAFEVSQYLVDKSYRQLVATHRARFGGAPERAAIDRWFRLFVAQQALKGWLSETGGVNRVEVQTAVTQMSRQILTQRDGPLDRTLHRPSELSEQQLRAVHEASGRVFDALIVRLDDEASARALLAGNPADLERRLRALNGSRAARGVDFHEGEIVWPYHPFEEISGELANAKRGQLIGPLSRQLGAYFFLVRDESRQAIPAFESVRDGLAGHVGELDRIMARRIRKRRVLNECSVSLDAEAVAKFWMRMAPANRSRLIPEGVTAGTEAKSLVTYALRGEKRRITEREFRDDFNRRFAAIMPRDFSALVTAIEDLVVEDYDYEAALAAGLNREPKFRQDQRAFELSQALAFYEKEVLAPQIAISRDELERHYVDHREQYLVPFEATGVLYVFAIEKLAQAGLRKLLAGEAPVGAERVHDPFVVRRDEPSVLSTVPNHDLLALPDGQRIGPVPYSDGFAIFAKRASGARRAPPLAEIESVVRSEVLRWKLDEMEIEIFQSNSATQVQLDLDLSKYGMENPSGRLPQARPAVRRRGGRGTTAGRTRNDFLRKGFRHPPRSRHRARGACRCSGNPKRTHKTK